MEKKKTGVGEFFKNLTRQQIFIPLVALILLAVFNLIADPGFFKITLGHNSAGDPVLSGYLITILDYGSELAILAIGMTLVTAVPRHTGQRHLARRLQRAARIGGGDSRRRHPHRRH